MIPFVGSSYTLNVRRADDQRTVNMFVIHNETPGGKSAAYLDSVPGLTAFSTDVNVSGYLLLETGFRLLTEAGESILLE